MKNFLSNSSIRKVRIALTMIMSLFFIGMIATAAANYGGNFNATFVSLMIGAAVLLIVSKFDKSERRALLFTSCVGLTANITLNCPNDLSAGVNATFMIANKDDISTVTYDGTNATLVTNIVMKTGKKFFKVEGQLQSTEPNAKMIKGKYVNQFEHEVKFLIFRIDADAKEQILKMKDGNFVIIIENNYTSTDGSTKYEGYGFRSGLKAESIERNPNDTENLGAFAVSLKTQEYARESMPPVSIFAEDSAGTEALMAALLVAAA